MSAHVVFTAIDPERPGDAVAPPSSATIIRGAIGFDGLLMTDDLSMHALTGTFRDRARARPSRPGSISACTATARWTRCAPWPRQRPNSLARPARRAAAALARLDPAGDGLRRPGGPGPVRRRPRRRLTALHRLPPAVRIASACVRAARSLGSPRNPQPDVASRSRFLGAPAGGCHGQHEYLALGHRRGHRDAALRTRQGLGPDGRRRQGHQGLQEGHGRGRDAAGEPDRGPPAEPVRTIPHAAETSPGTAIPASHLPGGERKPV